MILHSMIPDSASSVFLKHECYIVHVTLKCAYYIVAANEAGLFNDEMAPIEVKTKKGKFIYKLSLTM